ncbi:MAG: hypothetical protein A2W28_04895 [Gammaproteobacteria bacterium RBG_16_51_14]|nr:MAG: hypothetical protein A2W28_04895 [Gammaproteobacteria bacterium RBG_16_51_14]
MNIEQGLLSLIKRRYRAITGGFLLLGIICGCLAGYKVDHTMEAWLDQDSDSYRYYLEFIREFGDDATLLAVVNRADITPARLPGYLAFIEDIRANAGVSSVFDPVGMFLLNVEGDAIDEAVVDDLKKASAQRPADYRNVLMSRDMKTLAVLILLKQDHQALHPQIVQAVRQGLDNMGLSYHLAGTSYFSEVLAETLTHDLTVVLTGLIIITLVVMLYFLRSPVVVTCVMTGIGISLFCTLAFASGMDIQFNLLTLILYPLIFYMGITTAIHFFSRRDGGVWDLELAYAKTFRPSLIAMVTSVIGCCGFVFSPQTIMRDMGIVFPVGIFITFVVMMVFVPAAWCLLAGNGNLPCLPRAASSATVSSRSKGISLCLFAAAIVAVLLLPRLRTEPDAIYFFRDDSELIQSYRFIEDRLAGLLVMDMVVETNDGTAITTEKNIVQIRGVVNNARSLPGLTTIITPLDWLDGYREEVIMPELKQAYISGDKSKLRLTFRFRNISGSPYSGHMTDLKRLWNESAHRGLTMHVTGLLPLVLEAQDALLKTQAIVFPAILIQVTLILFLFVRSLTVLLFAFLANLLPLLLMAGAMVLLAIPINSINLFVAGVVLGVIADDTIHLLHTWHITGSVEATLVEVRPALWITTLTIVLAFTSLLFSSLRPVVQFGLLSAIAVSVAYLCDVFMLPWLLTGRRVPA